MKKILVAGGTGFIGYNVAKKAIEKKFKVYSISKNPAKKNRYIKKVKYIYLDLSKKNLKVPSINSYGNGDLLVNVNVWTPKTLTNEEKTILETFRTSANFIPEEGKKDGGFFNRMKEYFN